MKNVLSSILLCTSLISGQVLASQNKNMAIDSTVQGSLQFLKHAQYAEKSGYYSPGEWRVTMKSYLIPALVGLGRHFARPSEEATAFGTASIMNLLSEAYLLDTNLKSVPSILQKGLPSFQAYQEGDVFFYYPMSEFKGLRLHVPLDPHYVPRSMMSLALVPPDADTTSVSFLSLAFADKILNNKNIADFKVPEGTLKTFDQFRDLDRKPHLYNKLNQGLKNSGAYLTWLWDENEGPSKTLFKSMNQGPDKGYRIVFGSNDVDCVVNANVLRLLTLTKNTNENGYESSCEFLNQSILKTQNMSSQVKYCGLYYPNSFGAIYAISNAYKAGASCLAKSREKAIAMIIERQNSDGSWSNDEGIGREDRVQSTASALGALLNYIDPTDRQYVSIVQRGTQYLISQVNSKEGDQSYWKGEVFFSAGPAARSSILWRSDAYTTALSLLSLVKSKIYLAHEVAP